LRTAITGINTKLKKSLHKGRYGLYAGIYQVICLSALK